jgi:hypothetical protein
MQAAVIAHSIVDGWWYRLAFATFSWQRHIFTIAQAPQPLFLLLPPPLVEPLLPARLFHQLQAGPAKKSPL